MQWHWLKFHQKLLPLFSLYTHSCIQPDIMWTTLKDVHRKKHTYESEKMKWKLLRHVIMNLHYLWHHFLIFIFSHICMLAPSSLVSPSNNHSPFFSSAMMMFIMDVLNEKKSFSIKLNFFFEALFSVSLWFWCRCH